jgi:hypothetical protein
MMDKVECYVCHWVGLVPVMSDECLNPKCGKKGYLGTLEYDAPVNQVTSLLKRIGELGLAIDNDNCNFIIGNEHVEDVTNRWDEDRKWIIGSVPAENENLYYVEFDICFGVIERNHDNITSGIYKYLHKLAENNNAGEVINHLRKINDRKDIHASMADEIEDALNEVVSELKDLIIELGGNVNEN